MLLYREVCRAEGGIGSGETLSHDIYPARPITTVSLAANTSESTAIKFNVCSLESNKHVCCLRMCGKLKFGSDSDFSKPNRPKI